MLVVRLKLKHEELSDVDFSSGGGLKSRLVDSRFSRCMFDGGDFRWAVVRSCRFESCSFRNADFSDADDTANEFIRCDFTKASFRDARLGERASLYQDCLFDRTDLRVLLFFAPRFRNCVFQDCKFEALLAASSFEGCTFRGTLHNVVFSDESEWPQARGERRGTRPPHNTMRDVDFQSAQFRFVGFRGGLDLSTVEIPQDGRHFLFDRWPERLRQAERAAASWDFDGLFLLDRFAQHGPARPDGLKLFDPVQKWYIVALDEIAEKFGEDAAQTFLASLGDPVR